MRKGKLSELKVGIRYQLYASFSLTQLKSLARVMGKLNQRIMSDKSEIVFYKKEQVEEKIELGPMEQVRLSLKIYQREKKILQLEEELKGKPISFQHLLALSFELGKIDPKDFDYLTSIPGLWDHKKSTLEKIRDFSREYGFIIPLLTGPVGGYAYLLGVTLLDNYVNVQNKKNNPLGDFSHDLFYGSCDVKTL